MYIYKMVQVPRNIEVVAPSILSGKQRADPTTVAAAYIEAIVNDNAAQGWEFYRIDSVGVSSSPGCLGGVLGHKMTFDSYSVISFRKQA